MRQNHGSNWELCYVSPTFMTSTETRKDIVEHERDQHSQGSSDDDKDTKYPENFLNEDFWAGGPCLVPTPGKFYTLLFEDGLNTLNEECHWHEISYILSRFNINTEEHGVGMHHPKHKLAKIIPTLQIITQKASQDEAWLKASLEIWYYLVKNDFDKVSIEITDKQAFKEPFCSPIEYTNPIYLLWDQVCETVLEEVSWENLNIVEYFQMGYSENPMKNPPTIVVTVDRDSE